MNDILARLRNGESIEDIGNEFARMLNAAQSEYEAEVEAEEAKRRAEQEKANSIKHQLAQNLADAFKAYADFVAPELFAEGDTLTAAEVEETLDNVLTLSRIFIPMKDKVKVKVKKVDQSADDIISNFLNKLGW